MNDSIYEEVSFKTTVLVYMLEFSGKQIFFHSKRRAIKFIETLDMRQNPQIVFSRQFISEQDVARITFED